METSRSDKDSLFRLYRRLIQLRRSYPVLIQGSYRSLPARGDLLLFIRELRDARVLIALNMGAQRIVVTLAEEGFSGRVLLSSFGDREKEELAGRIQLRGNEGLIVRVVCGHL